MKNISFACSMLHLTRLPYCNHNVNQFLIKDLYYLSVELIIKIYKIFATPKREKIFLVFLNKFIRKLELRLRYFDLKGKLRKK